MQLEGEGEPVLVQLGGALNCSLLENAGGRVGKTALSQSFQPFFQLFSKFKRDRDQFKAGEAGCM